MWIVTPYLFGHCLTCIIFMLIHKSSCENDKAWWFIDLLLFGPALNRVGHGISKSIVNHLLHRDSWVGPATEFLSQYCLHRCQYVLTQPPQKEQGVGISLTFVDERIDWLELQSNLLVSMDRNVIRWTIVISLVNINLSICLVHDLINRGSALSKDTNDGTSGYGEHDNAIGFLPKLKGLQEFGFHTGAFLMSFDHNFICLSCLLNRSRKEKHLNIVNIMILLEPAKSGSTSCWIYRICD